VVSQFRRGRKGAIYLTLSSVETRILRHLFEEMLELLGPEEPTSDDPLVAALGIGTETKPPQDPALARLFPDAYPDDPEAAGEFRRYTEPTLREAKRAATRMALASISAPDERQMLTAEQADAWLRALNDTRLVLGERLGMTEDVDELIDSLDDDDPRLGLFWIYDRLTYLQETLVQALW
jgi:hypothetical protein